MVAHAPEGELVRIVGHVRRLRSFVNAPISGKPCVFYRAEVSMAAFDSKNGDTGGRAEVGYAEDHRDFFVEDETGQATVLATGAQIEFPAGWRDGFDHRIIRFLETNRRADMAQHLLSTATLAWGRIDVRHYETILTDGTPVSVLGRARWVPSAADPATATMNRSGGKHLILERDGQNPIVVSGHLKDWIDEYPLG